jgi:hypothetical protein
VCFQQIVDHGGRRGNAAQALAQWQHTVASSEARDVLHRHWVIGHASYRLIRMATKITSDLSVFFVIINSFSPTT